MNDRVFAFISRHEPTVSQRELAAAQGVELDYIGDRDAFDPHSIHSLYQAYDGVVVVHPLLAVRALKFGYAVGVFNNVNRAPIGERPDFKTDSFIITEV